MGMLLELLNGDRHVHLRMYQAVNLEQTRLIECDLACFAGSLHDPCLVFTIRRAQRNIVANLILIHERHGFTTRDLDGISIEAFVLLHHDGGICGTSKSWQQQEGNERKPAT